MEMLPEAAEIVKLENKKLPNVYIAKKSVLTELTETARAVTEAEQCGLLVELAVENQDCKTS